MWYLSASCFLFNNNQIYIAQVFQCFVGEENPIKVLDLNGKIIKGFDKFYHDPEERIYLLETYYDTNLSKIYIIDGGRNKAKSYDFKENKIYRIYDGKPNKFAEFHNLVIKKNGDKVKIMGYGEDSFIIWDFHLGEFKIYKDKRYIKIV